MKNKEKYNLTIISDNQEIIQNENLSRDRNHIDKEILDHHPTIDQIIIKMKGGQDHVHLQWKKETKHVEKEMQ